MSLGGILNVVLDPLFMFVILPEGHEIQGAAIATMLSNIAAFSYFLIYLRRHHAEHPVFDTDPRHLTLQDHVARDVITVGLPAALQTTFAMLSNIFANQLIKPYGSEAVAGMGVAKKINTFAFNSCMGLTQGILPLLGYSYGARNYQRMRKTIRFSGTIVFLFGCACTILFRTFADPLCRFFIDEAESVRYGTLFLRVIAFAAPLASLSYLMGTVFQASGHRAQAFVLSTMRKGFLDIPAMFLFSYALGLGAEGVVWATPFAEIVSAAIAVILYRRFLRSLPAVPSDPS